MSNWPSIVQMYVSLTMNSIIKNKVHAKLQVCVESTEEIATTPQCLWINLCTNIVQFCEAPWTMEKREREEYFSNVWRAIFAMCLASASGISDRPVQPSFSAERTNQFRLPVCCLSILIPNTINLTTKSHINRNQLQSFAYICLVIFWE